MPRCLDGAHDPAVARGPGVFLLGQGDGVKVDVLAEPTKDTCAIMKLPCIWEGGILPWERGSHGQLLRFHHHPQPRSGVV